MSVSQSQAHVWRIGLASSYLAFLAYITLVPHYDDGAPSDNFLFKLLNTPFIHVPTIFILNINPLLAVLGNLILFLPSFIVFRKLVPRLDLEVILLICTSLPIFIEIFQNWIPGRDPSVSDLLLNMTGIIFIYLISKFSRNIVL